MIFMDITERLRKLRLKGKKTLKETSSILNVSLNTVYRWEHGLSVPRKSVLRRMAEYYDVPFEWLLRGVSSGEDPECTERILGPDFDTEERILKMLRTLPEHSKYRILGYIERMCVEQEDSL